MKNKLFEKLLKKKNEFVIEVNNENEFNKLMELCEKFNTDDFLTIRWANECRPTKFDLYEFSSTSGRYIYFKRNFRSFTMTQSPPEIQYWNTITSEIIDFNDLFKQEIHITRKGNEVHAILKENGEVIKHTVANCHPEDKFDFKIGSQLAYDRLFEEESKKEQGGKVTTPYLNCKFIMLENMVGLTTGKIYEVNNGKFRADDGTQYPLDFLSLKALRTKDELLRFVGKDSIIIFND